jgi:hypothetical protein
MLPEARANTLLTPMPRCIAATAAAPDGTSPAVSIAAMTQVILTRCGVYRSQLEGFKDVGGFWKYGWWARGNRWRLSGAKPPASAKYM